MIVIITGKSPWGVEDVRAAGVVSERQKIIMNDSVEGYRNKIVQTDEKARLSFKCQEDCPRVRTMRIDYLLERKVAKELICNICGNVGFLKAIISAQDEKIVPHLARGRKTHVSHQLPFSDR